MEIISIQEKPVIDHHVFDTTYPKRLILAWEDLKHKPIGYKWRIYGEDAAGQSEEVDLTLVFRDTEKAVLLMKVITITFYGDGKSEKNIKEILFKCFFLDKNSC